MAISDVQRNLLNTTRQAARELGEHGKALTSLIGELWACEKCDLTWEPSEGYDAKLGELTFQIKTRKSWSTPEVNPLGRLGRYGTRKGYRFDVAVYVELDNDFNGVGIWHMGADEVKSLEERMGGNAGLHVHTFKKNAEKMDVQE
ncbi:MAG: hypothetical protein A2Z69_01605 [Bacteroidetes bacterium RBG_13_44_24]|nr:MAG: hypothetical protein A2Z69_01605 [Bacteroidetes bacterium RBG_13_44_24]